MKDPDYQNLEAFSKVAPEDLHTWCRSKLGEQTVGGAGSTKAIAMGEPEGMVKTIFNAETGALLGAHLIGPEVTEMIQGFVIAMKLETTEAELMETIFPHPTLSEAMHESVLDAFDKVIHQ